MRRPREEAWCSAVLDVLVGIEEGIRSRREGSCRQGVSVVSGVGESLTMAGGMESNDREG